MSSFPRVPLSRLCRTQIQCLRSCPLTSSLISNITSARISVPISGNASACTISSTCAEAASFKVRSVPLLKSTTGTTSTTNKSADMNGPVVDDELKDINRVELLSEPCGVEHKCNNTGEMRIRDGDTRHLPPKPAAIRGRNEGNIMPK
uniref:Uncharacterized protein n=1 Tax=Parascaris univalens TaxID=6257 RepID=A0A915BMH6_PARUN